MDIKYLKILNDFLSNLPKIDTDYLIDKNNIKVDKNDVTMAIIKLNNEFMDK